MSARGFGLWLCALLALGWSGRVWAESFSDLTSFQAASDELVLINFDDDASGVPFASPGTPLMGVYTSLGIDFGPDDLSSTLGTVVSPPYGWLPVPPGQPVGVPPPYVATFVATDVTAVGVYNTFFSAPAGATLSAYGAGDVLLETASSDTDPNTLDFFGLTTTEPIERIEITFVPTNPIGWGIDDLHFGQNEALQQQIPTFPLSAAVLFALSLLGYLATVLARNSKSHN